MHLKIRQDIATRKDSSRFCRGKSIERLTITWGNSSSLRTVPSTSNTLYTGNKLSSLLGINNFKSCVHLQLEAPGKLGRASRGFALAVDENRKNRGFLVANLFLLFTITFSCNNIEKKVKIILTPTNLKTQSFQERRRKNLQLVRPKVIAHFNSDPHK